MKKNKKTNNLTKLFFIAILTSLIMTGCGQTITSSETDYFIGTQGLEIDFLWQAPPNEVFEGNEFDIQLLIHNKGAFSLDQQDEEPHSYRAEIDLKYDSLFVIPTTDFYQAQTFDIYGQGLYADKKNIQLYGRSYYYPQGEIEYFALDKFMPLPVQGNFERSRAFFDISICYPYKTFFAHEVCIDVDPSGISGREQICQSQDYSFNRGQGAPIAITGVESQMIPQGQFVRPQFRIHIENKGDGTFSDFLTEHNDQGVLGCKKDIQLDDINLATYVVTLGGETLTCTPDKAIFNRAGKAVIDCELPSQSIYANVPNFRTSLAVEISYLYTQRVIKEVQIKRTASELAADFKPASQWDCPPWQKYLPQNQNFQGENICEDLCTYCQRNPTAKECFISSDSPQAKSFQAGFACVYRSVSECRSAGNGCILQDGFCEVGSFCGIPQCFLEGKNHIPRILYLPGSGDITAAQGTLLRFACEDRDDVIDPRRTCGCEEIGYYHFLKESDTRSCHEIPLNEYKQTAPGFFNHAQQRVEYSVNMIHYEREYSTTHGLDVCLAVKDKVGALNHYMYAW